MHRIIVFIVLVSFLSGGIFFAAQAQPPELEAAIERGPAAHPRLFFREGDTAALWDKIQGSARLKAVYAQICAVNAHIETETPLRREKVGKRLLGVSRAALQRISYLAFAYRMTGEESALRRAEQEMLAVSAFEDWNPSHFLDVAEMTAALAIGYDWLFEALSPDTRAVVRTAILEKGLRTSEKGGGWVTTENNWNQVCHGGLSLGALAVLEDAPALSRLILGRALKNVPRAMAEYAPDGVYPEGPSYWAYGTSYNVLLITALESALGSDFGLSGAPGFMQSPVFYLQATGPTGLYFNFSDCGERGGLSPTLHWFAARLEQPSVLWNQQGAWDALMTQASNAKGGDRLLPFLLIWAKSVENPAPPAMRSWKGEGKTPVAFLRTGWTAEAAYLGIKAGSPSANHAHMDAGSFVLEMEGVRWAIDLGAQDYHSLESKGVGLWNKQQDSERWTVFRLNNRSHNTLVVNDALQRVEGKAVLTGFSDMDGAAYARMDLTPVYAGQLEQAHRGARLAGNTALIQDEVKALSSSASVRWGMITRAGVEINAENPAEAVLRQDGKSMRLRVIAPEKAVLFVADSENPPQAYDAKNPGTRMICFETVLARGEAKTIAVLMHCGAAPELPELTPLSAW